MSNTGKAYRRDDPIRRAKLPPAVLCDFDDTTAVENVAELLLDHFSEDASWRELRKQSRDKIITLREYQESAFSNAFRNSGAGREDMKAVVRAKATLRPYFKELRRHCQAGDIPLAIVTVGLDFYVEALLEREGLEDVPRYAVKTTFTPQGIGYEYPHPWDGNGASPLDVCRQWGTCKCSVLNRYRKQGYGIFYVGDGRSDFCPASIADHVFARSHLAQLCHENQVTHTEFEDFRVVIEALESRMDQRQSGEAAVETE